MLYQIYQTFKGGETLEKRTSYRNSEFKAQEHAEKLYIEGYFIKYNDETNLYGDVYEEIDKRAVENSLKNNDIRGLWNHDTSLVLGRTGNGTLELKSDEVGLYGKIEINREDPQALGAYARIKRGDVSGCSFGFYPLEEEYQQRSDGGHKFVIKDLDLFEVSAVTFPAYPSTEISARSKQIEEIKKRSLDVKKQEIKKRLEDFKK